MWRAFFLAIGISMALLGAESLVIDQALMTTKPSMQENSTFYRSSQSTTKVIRPPEWFPWTFLSAGAVVMIYSFTIPKRVTA